MVLSSGRPITSNVYWSQRKSNPYTADSGSGSSIGELRFNRGQLQRSLLQILPSTRWLRMPAKPLSFHKVPEFRAPTMQDHPKVIWRDVKDFADFLTAYTIDLPQRERNGHLR